MSKNYTTYNTKTRTVQLIVDDSLTVGSSSSNGTQIYEDFNEGVREGVISTDNLFIDNGFGTRVNILNHLNDNYYTSEEIDELISSNMEIEGVGGLSESEIELLISNRLKNYYTSSQVNSKIDDSLDGYYTSSQVNSKINETLSEYYTSSEIDVKLQDLNSLNLIDDREVVSNSNDDIVSLRVSSNEDSYIISHGHIYTEKSLSQNISRVSGKIAYVGNTKYCNIDTDMLTVCSGLFASNNSLTKYEEDMPNLRCGYLMFANSTQLSEFDSNLSNLEDGRNMFEKCSSLKTFKSDLSSLKTGNYMFESCTSLSNIDFTSLNRLNDGDFMFSNVFVLKSFNYDMPNLLTADSMFHNTDIETFISDISKLYDGKNMFSDAPIKNFIASLSSLEDGTNMFSNTSLTVDSVRLISETIKNVIDFETKPTITITWTNVPTNNETVEKIKDYFLDIESKGWIVETNI